MLSVANIDKAIMKLTADEHLTIMNLFLDYCVKRKSKIDETSFKEFYDILAKMPNRRMKIKKVFEFGKIFKTKSSNSKLPNYLMIQIDDVEISKKN